MDWLLWAAGIYALVAVIVGAVTVVMLWDYSPEMAGLAALKMGLGWPYWLVKFLL